MPPDSVVSTIALLPPEALVRVELNDARTLVWSCTPRNLESLAAGWLVCEGIVRTPGEIEEVNVTRGREGFAAFVRVSLSRAAFERVPPAGSRQAALTVGPPVLGRSLGGDEARSVPGPEHLRPVLEDRDRVVAWFREMFGQAALRTTVGGVHTGGLVGDGRLLSVVEDVSRHHVVDRLVGSALAAAVPLSSSILLVSARISGAMAAKACRARVGAVVSRSVPTELAVTVAAAHGLTLVGRARREQPQYFWPRRGTSS